MFLFMFSCSKKFVEVTMRRLFLVVVVILSLCFPPTHLQGNCIGHVVTKMAFLNVVHHCRDITCADQP